MQIIDPNDPGRNFRYGGKASHGSLAKVSGMLGQSEEEKEAARKYKNAMLRLEEKLGDDAANKVAQKAKNLAPPFREARMSDEEIIGLIFSKGEAAQNLIAKLGFNNGANEVAQKAKNLAPPFREACLSDEAILALILYSPGS